MVAGKKNADPDPQSNPKIINMKRVVEKESMTMAIIDTDINVRIIFSLLQLYRILPPKIRQATSITPLAEKKYPGFAIPH